MLSETNSLLYHCNDRKRSMKFLSSDTYMIISQEDGKWLGQGMYFWDNLSNARYWKGEKRRKRPEEDFIIVRARVSMEKLLDLMDQDICESIWEIWNAWKKRAKIVSDENNIPLGKKLNVLYKMIPEFKNSYHVFKIYGKYNKTPPNNLFQYNLNSKLSEPTLAVKCIYNVKCNDAILERIAYQEE